MDTRLQDDLAMGSLELVNLAGRLHARYAGAVNLANVVAAFPNFLVELRVGQLV